MLGLWLLSAAVPAPAQSLLPLLAPATPAADTVSLEFRSALSFAGEWRRHPRWGEVWLPGHRSRDWRPYTQGRWIYAEMWGWYWIPDEAEADWGWITYHYGRWLRDSGMGWIWIPGDQWAPAWVSWRRGTNWVGWSALPPEPAVAGSWNEAESWVFVPLADLAHASVAAQAVPLRRAAAMLAETRVVNRTIAPYPRGPKVAVNPGVAPAIIAAAAKQPVTVHDVRPRILAGTRNVDGAMDIRPSEIRDIRERRRRGRDRERLRDVVAEKGTVLPAATIAPAVALAPQEPGRLGATPPLAAGGVEPPPMPPAVAAPGRKHRPPPRKKQRPVVTAPTPPQAPQRPGPAAPKPPTAAAPAPMAPFERKL